MDNEADIISSLIHELMESKSSDAFKATAAGKIIPPEEKNIFWLLDEEIGLTTEIYRFFPFERVKKIFETNEMALIQAESWDDPFENFFLRTQARDPSGQLISLDQISKTWYGQCWTLTKESDALWRIYSSDKNSVRVSTTIGKLFEWFYDPNDQFASINYFMSKVRYFDRATIEHFLRNTSFFSVASGGQSVPFAALLSIKRIEFEHEKEVRILKMVQAAKGQAHTLTVAPNQLFETITFDPRLDDCESHCRKHKLQSAGCTVQFEDSELYKIDRIVMPL